MTDTSFPRWVVPCCVAVGLLGCAHWQSRPAKVSESGAGVQIKEKGPAPAYCEPLGEISAKRAPLQSEDRVDIDLRESAAAMQGNLVVITERTTLSAKGQVHLCQAEPPAPPAAQPAAPAGPPAVQMVRANEPHSSELEEVALDQQAHDLFVRGRDAYMAQHYEQALRYFKAAYQLSRRYQLQYNIGQAADRLNRLAEALDAFEAYLSEAPPSEHRTEVEARVAVLRSTL